MLSSPDHGDLLSALDELKSQATARSLLSADFVEAIATFRDCVNHEQVTRDRPFSRWQSSRGSPAQIATHEGMSDTPSLGVPDLATLADIDTGVCRLAQTMSEESGTATLVPLWSTLQSSLPSNLAWRSFPVPERWERERRNRYCRQLVEHHYTYNAQLPNTFGAQADAVSRHLDSTVDDFGGSTAPAVTDTVAALESMATSTVPEALWSYWKGANVSDTLGSLRRRLDDRMLNGPFDANNNVLDDALWAVRSRWNDLQDAASEAARVYVESQRFNRRSVQ